MVKSCRRYWSQEIADSIVQLDGVRFDNPMFSLWTSFTRDDFTKQLIEKFKLEPRVVNEFFDTARGMNFYDDQGMTTGELFEKFFPGREDVIRLLMEPITYANGSTLEDPAISYGIVFSNFMSKGVFTFQGGTDKLIGQMHEELKKSGVDIRINCDAKRINVERGKVVSVEVDAKGATHTIRTDAVVSNANVRQTIFELVGEEKFDRGFIDDAKAVRLNNSSTQVYMAMQEGDLLDVQELGDLLFSSTAPEFRTEALLSRDITSRTYSLLLPQDPPARRPAVPGGEQHQRQLRRLGRPAGGRVPGEQAGPVRDDARRARQVRARHPRADGPRRGVARRGASEHYTHHPAGASFGTKFEGLAVSRALPQQITGLYHAGSVGIIMSGWLGAMNYGVIVANEVDNQLMTGGSASTAAAERGVVEDVASG